MRKPRKKRLTAQERVNQLIERNRAKVNQVLCDEMRARLAVLTPDREKAQGQA